MKLKNLLKNLSSVKIDEPFKKVDIASITSDSRQVKKNSLFIALEGTALNGADFIQKAIEQGAVAIVAKERNFSYPENVCFIKVPDPKKALRLLSRTFYGNPSQKVKTIGVTGTNGKTTVTYLMESMLKARRKTCGVLGTINYRIGSKIFPASNTTPGLLENQKFLFELQQKNIDYCIMEVSSHALDQDRTDLIDFCCAIFTNLTSDHLDYHKNTENYFQAKAKLFKSLSNTATAVISADDDFGLRLIKMTKAKVLTFGIERRADCRAVDIQSTVTGSSFRFESPKGNIEIKTKLIGRHNVYNILAAATAMLSQKIGLEEIRKGVEKMNCVPGRLERIDAPSGFPVFVDYAHTEDGLKNVLSSLRAVNPSRIILVFGCGGDRDRTKRPKMGAIASQLADIVVITSDNPRREDPQSIVDQIIPGFTRKNYQVVLDREEAIQLALGLAKKGDVVLVAGKGHEDYQIFKNEKIHFDDREVVRKFLGLSLV